MNPVGIAMLAAMAVFFIILACSVLRYDMGVRNKKGMENEWMLSDFQGKLYGVLFGKKDPKELAVKLKVDAKEYISDCEIISKEADFQKLIMHYLYGMIIFLLCLILSFFTSFILAFAGLLVMCYLCVLEKKLVHRKAEDKRHQIEQELPRFLDLLRTELNVGLPVETAIYVICKRTDTLLSGEFFLALRKMEFGANEWGEALENIAKKYNVELLSSFVLNVVTAYRKGVSVASAVDREYRDLHRVYVLNVKDRAERTKSAVLLPMFIFQLFPLIAFIALPLFITLMQYM